MKKRYSMIVPIAMEVMLLGKISEYTKYSNQTYLFENLFLDPTGNYVEPDYMQVTSRQENRKGAYLNWSLPDALTRGVQNDKEEDVEFPTVPNRWLISRLWRKQGEQELHQMHFLIESDVLQKKCSQENHNRGSASYPYLKDTTRPFRYLGRGFSIKESVNPLEEKVSKLTAISPGNPCFGAYLPGCENVFGYVDTLQDESGKPLEHVEITYSVSGWYQNEEEDILHDVTDAKGCIETLGWKPTDSVTFPAQTLCHGIVSNIKWETFETDYAKELWEDIPIPEVAVGNSSFEAIAALTQKKYPNVQAQERMLNYLFLGNVTKLEERDGVVKGEYFLKKKRFCDVESGSCLMIKEQEKENEDTSSLAVPPEIIEQVKQWNQWEKTKVEIGLELEQLQEQLFDVWVKYEACTYDDFASKTPLNVYEDSMDTWTKEMESKRLQIKQLELKQQKKLEQITKRLPLGYEISYYVNQRYWDANDPVLLLNRLQRNHCHGEDGKDSSDGTLQCRGRKDLNHQVHCQSSQVIDVADLWQGIPACNYPIPDAVSDCIGEAILLSENFADLLAKDSSIQVEQIKQMQSKAREGDNQGFDGMLPVANGNRMHKMPWSPLYLCWQITYYPDPEVMKEVPNLSNWSFNGIDGSYTGPALQTGKSITLRGRSIITPHAGDMISESIKELLPDTWSGEENLDVMSQRLDGFHDFLLMQDSGLRFPVVDYQDARAKKAAELIAPELKDYYGKKPLFNQFFSPIRAGYMMVNDLKIVDEFGQVLELKPDGIACAESLRDNDTVYQQRIMLPPRILQPASLKFDWVLYDNSPIVGWLLPNRVEESLMFYDPSGKHYGSLRRVWVGVSPVVWKCPPSLGGGTSELPADMNETMRKIAESILNPSIEKGEDLLTEYLFCLDDALWNINPSPSKRNQCLAQMVGRPILVANATMLLEVLGPLKKPKMLDNSKGKPKEFVYPHLQDATFSFQVGHVEHHQDSAIGYYEGDSFEQLHLCNDTTKVRANYFSLDHEIALKVNQGKKATILLDSSGLLHILSSILPVKELQIDPKLIEQGLQNIYLSIFFAPILTDAYDLTIPFSEVDGMEWSLLYKKESELEETNAIHSIQEQGYFPEHPFVAMEGYMKLKKKEKGEE